MLSRVLSRNDLHSRVLVSARGKSSLLGQERTVDHLQVVDFHACASIRPANYLVSIPSDSRLKRLISDSGSFIVNFFDRSSAGIVERCRGLESSFTDPFVTHNLDKFEAQKVDGPVLNDAKFFLECELLQELESGDHTVFLGRVLNN